MPITSENPNKTEVKGLRDGFVRQEQNQDFDVPNFNERDFEKDRLENLYKSVLEKNLHDPGRRITLISH